MKFLLLALSLCAATSSALPFGLGRRAAGHQHHNGTHPTNCTDGAPPSSLTPLPFGTPGSAPLGTPLAIGTSLPTSTPSALPSGDGIAVSYTIRSDAASTLASSIVGIASGASSCNSATSFTNECRTASEAAPYILASFSNYSITNTNVQAALISVMLYESGEFKYNWGHFVSGETVHTAGKGTRNMQSATYNEKYATSLFGESKVASAKSSGGEDGVLQLVSADEYSFASAAWFLKSQCEDSVIEGLREGTQSGYENYLTGCIGTTVDDSRLEYWTAAVSALSG